jgi:hypothetical protein
VPFALFHQFQTNAQCFSMFHRGLLTRNISGGNDRNIWITQIGVCSLHECNLWQRFSMLKRGRICPENFLYFGFAVHATTSVTNLSIAKPRVASG